MTGAPHDTAVVIVNFRTPDLTAAAVASVLAEPEVREVVVVDNASGDGSPARLRAELDDGRVRLVESDRNGGFGAGVNLGAAVCNSPLLLVLNSDARLAAGALGRLAKTLLADPAMAVIGPAVHGPDGREQPGTYGRLPRRRDLFRSNGWVSTRQAGTGDPRSPGWVSGVAMLFRRPDFEAVGGFDEGFGMYLEDVDLCRRIRAGGRTVGRDPGATVAHQGGKSWRSKGDQVRRFHASRLRYFEALGATPAERGVVRLTGWVRTTLAGRR